MKRLSFIILLVVLGATLPSQTQARIYLDITSADMRKLPVAVPSFIDKQVPGAISAKGKKMADLMGKALKLHGFISIIPSSKYDDDRSIDWKSIGADFVILGSYDTDQNGMVMELRLLDASNSRMITGKRYRAPWGKNSSMILKFCDETIFKLSGERGISNTQIAFVSDLSGKKEVYLADVLGENIRQVTRHNNLTVSPRFSPDGSRLAYTSYHRGNPNLYITDLSQNKSTKSISWRPGLNVAPSWSPDGKSMIITLSKDGNPDLYLMATNGKILKRLTRNAGINVSASWAPDGKRFTFVSDRSGEPQIYTMDIRTKQAKRITYSGRENTTPSWSPKGDLIAYTSLEDGNHHLFTISPDGGKATQLTQYWGEYESPSWSPDGRQIVFSRTRNGKQQICRIFIKGQGVTPMFSLEGTQAFPQWSPRLKY